MKNALSAAVILLFLSTRLIAGWVWNDPKPQGNRLAAAAKSTGTSTVVAVGDYGAALFRQGSGPWTSVGPIANGASLTGVVWRGDRFLAVGTNAGLWESLDGATWTLRDSSVRGYYLFDLGPSVVCLSASTSMVLGSGSTFQSYPLGEFSGYYAAAASGSNVVMVGANGFLASSSDGINWSKRNSGTTDFLYGVAGGPSGFLISSAKMVNGEYVPGLYTSAAGASLSPLAPPENAYFGVIFWGAQDWVYYDYNLRVLYQYSATGWQTVNDSVTGESSDFFPYASLSLSGTDALLFGERGGIGSLAGSGTQATLAKSTTTGIASSFLVPTRFAAAGIGNTCVALDLNVSRLKDVKYFQTTDGGSWSRSVPAPVDAMTALCVSGTDLIGYCAGTGTNYTGFYHSGDGISWPILGDITDPTSGYTPIAGPVFSFDSNTDHSVMVAVSRQESYDLSGVYTAIRGLYYSNNWVDWFPVPLAEASYQQPPGEESVESVHWDGRRFVLLLHPGRVFTSTDGKNWTRLPGLPDDTKAQLAAYGATSVPSASNFAADVASNGQTIVARSVKLNSAGYRETKLPSGAERFFVLEDGRWWACPVSGQVAPELRKVFWSGTQFCAIGNGEVVTSPDGFTWTSNPIEAPLASLLWTGSRFVAFTDAFGVLSHDGVLAGGAPIVSPKISPRVKNPSLTSASQSYSVTATFPAETPWQVTGIPSWLTVTPPSGVGPAILTVTVAENKSTLSRGAVLDIGGQLHLLSQKPAKAPAPITASYRASTISIPYSGPWSVSANPASLVQFPKNATTGRGAVVFSIPPNNTPQARTITLNINGQDYPLTQQGQTVAALRAGAYSGLVGSVAEGYTSNYLDNFDFFQGSINLTVTAPTLKNPNGAYSAQVTCFTGTTNVVYRGAGSLDAQGALQSGTWKASGTPARTLVADLSIVDDWALNKWATGTLALDGTSLNFLAGKQVFNTKYNPVASEDVGKSTFFLTPAAGTLFSSDSGAASATILADGTVRIAGSLADGSALSFSSFLWGASGSRLMFPFSLPVAKGKGLIVGYAGKDLSNPDSDWNGPAFQSVSGVTPVNLSAAMSRYTAPKAGSSVMNWTNPAPPQFKIKPALSTNIGAINGTASLSPKNVLSVKLELAATRLNLLSLNTATGIVSGSILDPVSKKTFTLFGAVNQKFQANTTDRGAIAGFLSPAYPGVFSILPE